jgi:hypothetical protein
VLVEQTRMATTVQLHNTSLLATKVRAAALEIPKDTRYAVDRNTTRSSSPQPKINDEVSVARNPIPMTSISNACPAIVGVAYTRVTSVYVLHSSTFSIVIM